jgi:hypothetical protein
MDCSKNPPPSPFFKGGSQKSFSLAAFIDSPFKRRNLSVNVVGFCFASCSKVADVQLGGIDADKGVAACSSSPSALQDQRSEPCQRGPTNPP